MRANNNFPSLDIRESSAKNPDAKNLLNAVDGLQGHPGIETTPDGKISLSEYRLAKIYNPEQFSGRTEDTFEALVTKPRSFDGAALSARHVPPRTTVQRKTTSVSAYLDGLYSKMSALATNDKLTAAELSAFFENAYVDFKEKTLPQLDFGTLARSSSAVEIMKKNALLIGESERLFKRFLPHAFDDRLASASRDSLKIFSELARVIETSVADPKTWASISRDTKNGPLHLFSTTAKPADFSNSEFSVFLVSMHGGTVISGLINATSENASGSTTFRSLSQGDAPVSHFNVVIRDDRNKLGGGAGAFYVIDCLATQGCYIKKMDPYDYMTDENGMIVVQVPDHTDPTVAKIWQRAFENATFDLAQDLLEKQNSFWRKVAAYVLPAAAPSDLNFDFALTDEGLRCVTLGWYRIMERQPFAQTIEKEIAALPATQQPAVRQKLDALSKMPAIKGRFEGGRGNEEIIYDRLGTPKNVERALQPVDVESAAQLKTLAVGFPAKTARGTLHRDGIFSALINYFLSRADYQLKISFSTKVKAFFIKVLRNTPILGYLLLGDTVQPHLSVDALATILSVKKLSAYFENIVVQQQTLLNQERKRKNLPERMLLSDDVEALVIEHVKSQEQLRERSKKAYNQGDSRLYEELQKQISPEVEELLGPFETT